MPIKYSSRLRESARYMNKLNMQLLSKFTSLIIALISINAHAGAWGIASFQNDHALDWFYDIESSNSTDVLISSFNLIPINGYIEAPICINVLAAAEIVASMKDQKTKKLPPKVTIWINANKDKINIKLLHKALKAVNSCTEEKRSELFELWNEPKPTHEWNEYIIEMKSRLK